MRCTNKGDNGKQRLEEREREKGGYVQGEEEEQ